ncbi:MAG: response regulator [Dehalococcoidia bacterium]|nr:response regulator [Dehalococcoidia bacterium]
MVGAVILEIDARQFLYPLIESWSTSSRTAETLLVRRDGDSAVFLNDLRNQKDAALALDLARESQPNLILLDLHLPDMHGSEVLRRLRDEPGTRGIPVVILSADANPDQIECLKAAGAHDYLTKPLDVRQLLHVVDKIVGH